MLSSVWCLRCEPFGRGRPLTADTREASGTCPDLWRAPHRRRWPLGAGSYRRRPGTRARASDQQDPRRRPSRRPSPKTSNRSSRPSVPPSWLACRATYRRAASANREGVQPGRAGRDQRGHSREPDRRLLRLSVRRSVVSRPAPAPTNLHQRRTGRSFDTKAGTARRTTRPQTAEPAMTTTRVARPYTPQSALLPRNRGPQPARTPRASAAAESIRLRATRSPTYVRPRVRSRANGLETYASDVARAPPPTDEVLKRPTADGRRRGAPMALPNAIFRDLTRRPSSSARRSTASAWTSAGPRRSAA